VSWREKKTLAVRKHSEEPEGKADRMVSDRGKFGSMRETRPGK